ncbi:MAG: hypothetical protein Kow0047_03770 [Anaerolineae bacterium]
MIISDKLPPQISRAYATQPNAQVERPAPNRAQTGASGRDELSLSEEAHILQQAVAAAKAGPDVRADRVAELKRMIEAGQYEIAIEELIDRLLGME